mmetsp:Transcript_18179/g.28471  ORF Transcript_18179/g.28471 Transcript_18179/m.28471 type:complete len:222 (+) Transcript_18179:8416-9081(+)
MINSRFSSTSLSRKHIRSNMSYVRAYSGNTTAFTVLVSACAFFRRSTQSRMNSSCLVFPMIQGCLSSKFSQFGLSRCNLEFAEPDGPKPLKSSGFSSSGWSAQGLKSFALRANGAGIRRISSVALSSLSGSVSVISQKQRISPRPGNSARLRLTLRMVAPTAATRILGITHTIDVSVIRVSDAGPRGIVVVRVGSCGSPVDRMWPVLLFSVGGVKPSSVRL